MRRVRQRLESIYEDAVFHERATVNVAAATRRKLAEARPVSAQQRLRALDYRDAPALMARIRAVNATAARCLEFAALTASRTAEALGAQWREIDTQAGVWTVPADRMTAGEPHRVPLSPRALAIIEAQRGHDAVYVFPSPMREGAPLSNMALLATLDRLGARGRTTTHGLCRATFSTWVNQTAAARPDAIEAVFAHSEGDRVRRAYNRAAFETERRALLEGWSRYLEAPRLALVA